MRKLWQTSKVKTGEVVLNRSDHLRKSQGCSKCVHVRTREDVGRIEKWVIRSAHTKWMAPNKCYAIFSALVRPSALEHHLQQGECCFLSS